MKYAIFTVSLPEYTPEQGATALAPAGYDGIEWRVVDQAPAEQPGFWAGNRCTWPLATLVEDAPRIRQIAEGAGLAMPSLGTYASCAQPEAVDLAMRGAVALGVGQLRINVPALDPGESYRKQRDLAQAQYREVAAMARRYGVRALIEIHMGNLVPSASAAALFLAPFDPREVGVIHDAGNMVYEGYEHYRLGLEQLGPHLAHVHLKNAAWRQVGQRADGSAEWQPGWAGITSGAVDFAALLRALRQVGYDGWLSFEDFSTEQPLAERVRGNLAYIRALAERVAAEG